VVVSVADCVADWVVTVVIVPCAVKSTSTLVPVSVTVLVTGPNPFPEAVTVMVPELWIGNA